MCVCVCVCVCVYVCVQVLENNWLLERYGDGQTKLSITNHAHNPNLASVQVSHMKVHNK